MRYILHSYFQFSQLIPCRKFKQLAPKAGAVPAAQVLIADPKAASKKTSPQAEQKIKAKAVSTSTPHNSVTVRKDSVVAQEPPAKKAKPLKPLPPIIWTSVATNLNLEEAEMRFQIREFTLRFACVMEPTISRTHLGELDGIRSSTRGSEDMTGWVSETCVRSLLLGTLYLLVDIDKGSIEKASTVSGDWPVLNADSVPSSQSEPQLRIYVHLGLT